MATAAPTLPAAAAGLRDGATLGVAAAAAWVSTARVITRPAYRSSALLRSTCGVQTLRTSVAAQRRTAVRVATQDSTVVPPLTLRDTHVAGSRGVAAHAVRRVYLKSAGPCRRRSRSGSTIVISSSDG